MKKERVVYLGEAQLLTQLGALPLTFEIKAGALGEATEKVAAGAKVAVERAVKGLQEMRREAASPVIIPEFRTACPRVSAGPVARAGAALSNGRSRS